MIKRFIFIGLAIIFSIKIHAQCTVNCSNSDASGTNSTVIGPSNFATAINSVTIGNNCVTDGWHSIAIGTFAKTTRLQ